MGIFTPLPHYAGKKFRNGFFHSGNATNVFLPYTTPEFENGTITGHFIHPRNP